MIANATQIHNTHNLIIKPQVARTGSRSGIDTHLTRKQTTNHEYATQ